MPWQNCHVFAAILRVAGIAAVILLQFATLLPWQYLPIAVRYV
jgi:hypothetical protein